MEELTLGRVVLKWDFPNPHPLVPTCSGDAGCDKQETNRREGKVTQQQNGSNKVMALWTGEMTQWLRGQNGIAKDISLVHSTHCL